MNLRKISIDDKYKLVTKKEICQFKNEVKKTVKEPFKLSLTTIF